MCGFVGFHSQRDFPFNARGVAKAMGDTLRRRGPDASGEWIDEVLGVALSFRRLSIVDLSPSGHQPMRSQDGRLVLAVNGEIYNHAALRIQLAERGRVFRGHCDIEVLLEAIALWGLEETLRQCVGMFALALVDLEKHRLWLARDRFGEKPLYYGWSKNHFLFGSELKAFRPHPDFVAQVDSGGLSTYLTHGYVPSPYSILSGFHKLKPGCILSLPLDGSAAPGKEAMTCYWSIPHPAEQNPLGGRPEDLVAELEELLRRSIRFQMQADVPVGAFLSGGIDSSALACLMQSFSSKPIKTFTIGFPDVRFDESLHAARVARHVGTDHTTWRCKDSELLDLITEIPQAYSEPFADDSQIPTMALSKLARTEVKVSLSGDGADEIFLGYGRYKRTLHRWRQLNRHPMVWAGMRGGIASVAALTGLLVQSPLKQRLLSQLDRARRQCSYRNLADAYRYYMSVVKAPALYLRRFEKVPEVFDQEGANGRLREDFSSLGYLDLLTYLPDDLLVKVDRAAMAFGLETRMPYLDHRVVEFAARIPEDVKRWDGRPKWMLRQLLARHIPRELTERPKMGFCPPIGRWLRGPLHDWAESQLGEERLRREGFFDPVQTRRLWHEHVNGGRNRGTVLWPFLMFQAWHEMFFDAPVQKV